MKYLLLPAELQVREFWGRLLIALAAAEKGAWSIVGDQVTIWEAMPYCRPGLMFLKSIPPHKLDWYYEWKEKGFRFCSMDEESLATYQYPDFPLYRFSKETVEMAEQIYCWGTIDYDCITPHYEESKDKFVKTGNPRFDLWREPLRKVHQAKVDKIKSKYGDFILVPSNFSGIFHGMGRDFVINQAIRMGVMKTQEDIDKLVARQDHTEKCRLKYVDLIKELAKTRKVVLRPHPSENEHRWRDCFAGVDNVAVAHEGEIAPWILASDLVLHHGCSTGVESALLGVPAVAYLPFRDPKYDGHLSIEVSWEVEDFDEALKLSLDPNLECAKPRVDLDGLLTLDDKPAFDRVTEEVLQICDIDGNPDLITESKVAYRALRDVKSVKEDLLAAKAATRKAKEDMKKAKEAARKAQEEAKLAKKQAKWARQIAKTKPYKLSWWKDLLEGRKELNETSRLTSEEPESTQPREAESSTREGRIEKWDRVEVAEVEEFISTTGKLLGRFQQVAVTEVETNVFLIHPKQD